MRESKSDPDGWLSNLFALQEQDKYNKVKGVLDSALFYQNIKIYWNKEKYMRRYRKDKKK